MVHYMPLSYAVSSMLCCRAMVSLGTKMGFLFLIIVGVLGVGHLPAMADALWQRPCLQLSSLGSVVGQVLSRSLKDSFPSQVPCMQYWRDICDQPRLEPSMASQS